MKHPHQLIPAIFVGLALLSSSLQAEQEPAYRGEVQITTLLKTDKDSAGRKIEYPKGAAELTAVIVTIPVGAKTGWHEHPFPCMAYVLEGELQVEQATGVKSTIKQGEAFAEVVNLLHSGVNVGNKPVKLVMFVAGEKGQPFAVKKQP